jgi:ABC-2 type transport system ATP-binding protein
MEIIWVENLCKYFRVNQHHTGTWGVFRNLFAKQMRLVRAVDGVSFSVQAGEIVGYLGPNGAGKSTTVKILTGLLVPTSGTVKVNSFTPWQERTRYVQRIGAVFGQRTTLWWDLPVIESFELIKYIYGISPERYRENLSYFRELLDLDPFIEIPVRSLSLGQRMRADLCAALLHDPAILFLDEPTIGLDVVAKERIRQFILNVNSERGVTVVLTTHDLSDVEKLCERIMILDQGRLLFDGKLQVLKDRFGGERSLVVDFAENYAHLEVDDAKIIKIEGKRVTFQFERQAIAASELIGRITAKYRIQDLQVLEPDIEDTIRNIYEKQLLSHE